MQIIKYIILFILLGSSSYIGILISKRYGNRTKELKEMKNALNILSTQIKFTYEPLPKIFKEISEKLDNNIGEIFKNAYNNMEKDTAGLAWIRAIDSSNTNLNKEDKEVLKNLSNLLGQVDAEGQLKEIELVNNFLDMQIEKSEQERRKNEKLYKTLGVTIGMAIVIILI